MIELLKNLFTGDTDTGRATDESDSRKLAIAATALMVQLSRVDRNEDERELQTIVDCAVEAHEVSRQDAQAILDDARNQADDATSLYEFTGQLNELLDQAGKRRILESIWRVAFADGRIDKYEEHMIRRMADLLHLNHREYMESRYRAEQPRST